MLLLTILIFTSSSLGQNILTILILLICSGYMYAVVILLNAQIH